MSFITLPTARVSPRTTGVSRADETPRVIDDGVRTRMKEILREIETGEFAREFLAGHEQTAVMMAREADSPLAQTGHQMLPRLHPTAEKN